jgi:hypothetical protein
MDRTTTGSFPAFLHRSAPVAVDLTWIVMDHPQDLFQPGFCLLNALTEKSREVWNKPSRDSRFVGG